MFTCSNVDQIVSVMNTKEYAVFKDSAGHDLNIAGIRTASLDANTFNDWLTVFYRFEETWILFGFPATTDPGVFYREQPINVKGTAIVKAGQYRGANKFGWHKRYEALQQKGSITVYRDRKKNDVLDTDSMDKESGLYEINTHRANPERASRHVDKWSAGCQVIQDPDHFGFVMTLCERAKTKYGNSFSYTLLEESDF